MRQFEAEDRRNVFVAHAFEEQRVDLGEVRLNYARVGDGALPALLLLPGQSESWWGYEQALPLLADHFQAYAVDLRGQGQSTWTPGRYTLDNMGNDLVRFIDLVIGRPTIVSGLSSGGVLSAWLSAYAKPGQIRGAVYEDPPLFASELVPDCGQSIRQGLGPLFALQSKWLGDQWTIGDWKGMQAAARTELPSWMRVALEAMRVKSSDPPPQDFSQPPQNLKEYDPEWARAFSSGTVTAGCDHARMLASVRVPVLFTHHFRMVDLATGTIMGAISDLQAERTRELVAAAGQPFTYLSFPHMAHSMHAQDPALFAATLAEWSSTLEKK
ncbi:MAG: alpha/beta hydrolase [Chloroflexota bacterium]|nr:alpha/beta hydrolase [Chloroflexota bacterium]